MLIEGNCLYIVDLKSTKEEIFRSLPQITAYGKMILNKIKVYNLNVKCISFNQEVAIEFDPSLMAIKIINFVDNINKIRKINGLEPLKTKGSSREFDKELLRFL